MEDIHDDHSVYEIGYLIAGSVPDDAISGETEKIKKILADSGATVIDQAEPNHIPLAYEMRVKKVSGSYEKFKAAYFGWVKFEVGSDMIDGVKQSVEKLPSILRPLVTTTVRENTYLGKRASAILLRPMAAVAGERSPLHQAGDAGVHAAVEEKREVTPATIEEMDKSIDEMVKEAV